ncbi:hypothetical protein BO71DRAFT_367866 [Aspergillus ellipticus CBS 707.79]|uniref:Zn(2)-C6 fungal-type domain-containing protein n=1 Tax=Aspergillus ellipticus CBS 707.79 TaxID=1448320 RepID=A0A319EGD7_9EURO|nr:hypothetical protein BO71DRAFT_367866 [Aspergillus ellipticus CBS 707.79]
MTEPADGPGSKRRKVRKGTQSCWECKRRKVRCIFASAAETICNNCRRRGTVCISQEHADCPVPSASSEVEARLGRPATFLSQRRTITPNKHEVLANDLIATWPSQAELDIIYTLPVGLSMYLHCVICSSFSRTMGHNPLSPREMLQLPPPGSHPVLIARKLLVLGTFLQSAPPSSIEALGGFSTCYHDIMSRVVDRATRLVNTNEDLNGSVEGIECIMLEAMYHNYAGNLHRAWMAVHRAAAIVQIMGLHRGLISPCLKILEPETRAAFNPDTICLHLVVMDRYLSLMLGLPPTSLEARFATPTALEKCDPIDRMQRIHCVISGRILQRSNADVNNLAITQDIDRLLQKAAAEMPPKWWLVPTFDSDKGDGEILFHDTVRLMEQFWHYHLVIRLHLPYMLCSSSDRRYDASKSTVVTSSREILSRYVAFRTYNPAHFYCRGCDFLAFVATTVLCLVHIDSHSEDQKEYDTSPFNALAHSRLSDCGMMERTLDIMQSMARTGTDEISSRLSPLIQQLLTIEANSANGTIYSTQSSSSDDDDIGCGGKLTNGGKGLNVHIPYFGTIKFEHGSISSQPPGLMDIPAAGDWELQGVDVALFDSLFRGTSIPDVDEEATWAQWVDMSDRNRL